MANNKLIAKIKQYQKRFPSVKNLTVKPSNKKDKRFVAEFQIGAKSYKKHFGLKNAFTYFDGAPITKRNGYIARASKITNKDGKYTYKIPGTSNSFAFWILW